MAISDAVLLTPAYGTLRKIEKTCSAFPAQWEAETIAGHFIYARYRWDWLIVETAPTEADWVADIDVHVLFEGEIGPRPDGEMTTAEMLELTGMVLA